MIWQSLRSAFLLTLTAATLLACSSASAAALVLNSIESGLNADNASDFSEDLKHELMPLIRTLQRPVKFFHYGNRGFIKNSYRTTLPVDTLTFNKDEAIDLKRRQLGAKVNYSAGSELSPPEAGNYFLAMAAHFNKIQSSGWYVGPGLYGAVDPVQSESYMGKPWFLLEINAPRGLRYLDLRPEGKRLILSQSFIQKWVNPESGNELNSHGQTTDGRPIFKLKVNDLLALPKLGQIFRAAMKEMKIDAIAYAWLSSTISYCREVNHDEASAFNFMNDEGMARGIKLRVFTQE
ncbi:MAG: hypothetical protein H7333_01655, partial [Bdellovibrionales bacterium]|nr:hypothetical protein [Oligoflexia bacterium]